MAKVTKEAIDYCCAPYGHITTIPKGTPVIPADNLPKRITNCEQYWAKSWEGMDEQVESWMRNYGFLLVEDEVEDV